MNFHPKKVDDDAISNKSEGLSLGQTQTSGLSETKNNKELFTRKMPRRQRGITEADSDDFGIREGQEDALRTANLESKTDFINKPKGNKEQ
jgi:hypothetical protein